MTSPETVTRHMSLSFMQTLDSREPRTMRLMLQDTDWNVDVLVDLTEREFVALLAGQNITLECEV